MHEACPIPAAHILPERVPSPGPNGCNTPTSPASPITCHETAVAPKPSAPTAHITAAFQLGAGRVTRCARSQLAKGDPELILGHRLMSQRHKKVTSAHFRAALHPVRNNAGKCLLAGGLRLASEMREMEEAGLSPSPSPPEGSVQTRSVCWQSSAGCGG